MNASSNLEKVDPGEKVDLRHKFRSLDPINRLKAVKMRAIRRSGKPWREIGYAFCMTPDRAKGLVARLDAEDFVGPEAAHARHVAKRAEASP